jgi:glycosyltransferase involved in cell wall biosynthesis
MKPNYVVITPVRNEGAHIRRTIDSMAAQTLLPRQWVIVDDGSSDDTPAILAAAAAELPWVTVVTRADRGMRKSGGGVVEAVNDGLAALADASWDFLVKLDGDLSFEPDYFLMCLRRFDANERLGIGGGTVCFIEGDELKEESVGDPPFHVRGATKIYRRACWEDIAPLVQAPGWDTLDEVKANMKGWTTQTFPDERIVQHKPTGTADGSWLNWFKNGRGCYVCGYDPLFMLAKCVKRAFATPILVPGLALGAGFCSGYIRRLPRVPEADVVRYLRSQQRRRLLMQSSIYG